MSLESLAAEYEAVRIGPEILSATRDLCRQAARSYPPTVYASPYDRWTGDAIDDLVQEVVVDRLLGEGQLEYIMVTAATLGDFERLVIFQAKRTLARRRTRTVVDNLLARAIPILSESPFAAVGSSPQKFYLAGDSPDMRDPTRIELRLAAVAVRAVPRVPAGGTERAPTVYRTADLPLLLEGVAKALPVAFTRRDLDEIFRLVLTDWIPTDLEELEHADIGSRGSGAEPSDPATEAVVEDVVQGLLDRLNGEQARILRMKGSSVADSELAAEIGISRPTLARRKDAVFDLVRAETDGLDQEVQELIVERLLANLVARGI